MNKKIIVDVNAETTTGRDQKKDKSVYNGDNSRKKNIILEWVLSIICYTIVLITVSLLFKSFYISNEHYGLYALLASLIIRVLNQTIKPILVSLTLPLTALTLGLFYPIINVIILYITSFILGDKFQLTGIIMPFFVAILISFLNILMEGMVIRPLVNKGKHYD